MAVSLAPHRPQHHAPQTAVRNFPAYMMISAQNQGEIRGSSTIRPHEGKHEVMAYRHRVEAPKDVASGKSVGKRTHSPLEVFTQLDESSPLLYQALINNEVLPSVTLEIYRTSQSGHEECCFTIELEQATIESITNTSFDPQYDALNSNQPTPLELITFRYESIVWRSHKLTDGSGGSTHASDDWNEPYKR